MQSGARCACVTGSETTVGVGYWRDKEPMTAAQETLGSRG